MASSRLLASRTTQHQWRLPKIFEAGLPSPSILIAYFISDGDTAYQKFFSGLREIQHDKITGSECAFSALFMVVNLVFFDIPF